MIGIGFGKTGFSSYAGAIYFDRAEVYEVILGRLLLKAAFRRKMAPYVQETDQFADKAGHRPSRLYQRNRKDWYDVL